MHENQSEEILALDETVVWPHRRDEPIVVLPYYGEFGHFVNSFIRQVHYLYAPAKIVCCRPGEEVYFPSATGFYYDWNDPFYSDKKVGFRDGWPPATSFPLTPEEVSLLGRLRLQFREHRITALTQPLTTAQVVSMHVPITIRSVAIPRFDLVVCCRRRSWEAYRNFDRWPEVLAPLSARGFTVAIVGEPDTSYDFDFVQFRSWTHAPNAEAVVEALSNARLYIGTDTGPSHLAALVSPALLLFRNEACPHQNYIKDVLSLVAANRFVPFRYLSDGWENPTEVSETALRFLVDNVLD
jgi:hypothetical protein